MGLFDAFRQVEPPGDPLTGGADGFFDVLDGDGRLVRYAPDDFDEIWTTTDEREAGHHVTIGWILLDEVVGAGDGPGHTESRQKPVYTGGEPGAIGGGRLAAQRPRGGRSRRRHDLCPRPPEGWAHRFASADARRRRHERGMIMSQRAWEVASADGSVTHYTDDDFDEIWETIDEHEMRRHIGLGWVLLDESVGAGEGPGHQGSRSRGTPGVGRDSPCAPLPSRSVPTT